MTTSKQYDFLNRLTQISSVSSVQSVVNFSYQYNNANQRTRVRLADGSYWAHAYDSLGQVVSGHKFWADGTPVAGQQFDYGFDTIGNRAWTKSGGDQNGASQQQAYYTANNLNQYASRDVPGVVDVMGIALATNTVQVDSVSAYRKGEYFRREVSVVNTSVPVWKTVNVTATGETNVSRSAFVPKTREQFGYDLDGNLTSDGRWNYTWDGENRLVKMTANTGVGPQISLQFDYDWQGRRVRKQVWSNTAWSGEPTNKVLFVYDGWNAVGQLNATNKTVIQSYMWGLDVSGSGQGAGGVGGLLAVRDVANGTHFAAFDGNGNASALAAAGDGAASARYEYGPFGEVIRATGSMAKANPFRFSTKWQDDETDFLYYGYRYLGNSTGRWLSRDPIEEDGFYVLASARNQPPGGGSRKDKLNIYTFVQNAPTGSYDRLGLQCDPAPMCGPNVTSPLSHLIAKVYSTWNGGWSQSQRDAACDGLFSWDYDPQRQGVAWLMAWDIDRLWRGGQGWINAAPYCPPCATQPTCKNTVQVFNRCYYAGSVNYVLYGHMFKLCGFRKQALITYIWLYKRNSPNYIPSRDWAIAGYDGWPTRRAILPVADRSECAPACAMPYSGPPFKFYWYPQGWN